MSRRHGEHACLIALANLGRSHVPRPVDPTGPSRAPRRVEVFAVSGDEVQITWSALGPGPGRVRVGDRSIPLTTDGGPGAVTVGGLTPGRTERIAIEVPSEAGAPARSGAGWSAEVTTLDVPGGARLARLATVSDVHLGSGATGFFHTMTERPTPATPSATRCLDAAVEAASAIGAERLIVKGDLVDGSDAAIWALAGERLARFDGPVSILPGNHERNGLGDIGAAQGAASIGHPRRGRVEVVDHGAVRLVLVDTAVDRRDRGTLRDAHDEVVAAAAWWSGPVLVFLHHQPMCTRIPRYIPVGIPRAEFARFAAALRAANPRSFVTSGHTHRHRRHDIDGVVVTEVGSTRDFPGTWAAYDVHEDGIVQVVRRIDRPDCIRWTDHTRRAALGAWGRWAPGSLDQRCFVHRW